MQDALSVDGAMGQGQGAPGFRPEVAPGELHETRKSRPERRSGITTGVNEGTHPQGMCSRTQVPGVEQQHLRPLGNRPRKTPGNATVPIRWIIVTGWHSYSPVNS